MIKPLVRWTIGNTRPDGFECLKLSVDSFVAIYDVEPIICFNCSTEIISKQHLDNLATLIDQREHVGSCVPSPKGVAWKLYPPRLAPDRHEIIIDNDLILVKRVPQIDEFFGSDCTLLLSETGCTYGRFSKHVPPGYHINSGLYGMPPGFNLQKFVDFYVGDEWEENAKAEHKDSKTFDEQGLIAIALASYPRQIIIPHKYITNCEHHLQDGHGYHFIGLNRRHFHRPYREWRSRSFKLYL